MSFTNLLYRDPFTPGAPTAPSESAKNAVSTLWGYAGWTIAVIACFGLAGACVMAWSNNRQGQSNEGVTKGGWVLGSCLAFGVIVGVVGTVTGT